MFCASKELTGECSEEFCVPCTEKNVSQLYDYFVQQGWIFEGEDVNDDYTQSSHIASLHSVTNGFQHGPSFSHYYTARRDDLIDTARRDDQTSVLDELLLQEKNVPCREIQSSNGNCASNNCVRMYDPEEDLTLHIFKKEGEAQ